MRICLIRPPVLVDVKGYTIDPTPPIGLAYIAAAISDEHEVKIIDAVGERPNQLNKFTFDFAKLF